MDIVAMVVGVLGFISSIITVIVNSSKNRAITDLKIEELTQEVKKHNGLVERMYDVEKRVTVIETKIN